MALAVSPQNNCLHDIHDGAVAVAVALTVAVAVAVVAVAVAVVAVAPRRTARMRLV